MPAVKPPVSISAAPRDNADLLRAWQLSAPTPMQTPQWMLAWWDIYRRTGDRLHVIALQQGNHIVAVVPAYVRMHRFWANELRLLGDACVCSDFQTLLCTDGDGADAARIVAEWLSAQPEKHGISLATWDGIAPGCSNTQRLFEELERTNHLLVRESISHTWRIETAQGWTEVLKRMSRTGRKQSRNMLNRLDRGMEFAVEWAQAMDDVQQAIRICMDLHQQQWLLSGCQDSCGDGRFEEFLLRAARGLVPLGMMEVGVLRHRRQSVAALIALVDAAGNRYFYQTGRSPAASHLSPGRMLFLAAIRRACDLGAHFVDFLRGDELYKRRFGATPTPCLRVRIIPPDRLSRLYYHAWTLGRGFKHCATEGISSFAEPIPTVS
ncbi:MAG: GNAT family N-acetyltransferase [Planctomycetota bacterium]|nr:MAG: GNAT family N-acetyltransferase [Planctomycetota bacterium]